ncbi:class I SAM-dependent methyltransferase [Peribacillus alkalitolerans]|uniref:class I SAM-dependent methyltransferase n=1 Tax=Peribacillus alkalitolerans TaxID=1550385 RepID=UPI0013CFD969|nr:class I SAM-dependent methyltransferase [Peribacillus alkalitolerans]
MNNSWNKVIYKMWSPIYDYFFNAGPFRKAREAVFSDIPFKHEDKILFVGVGTGVDLLQIPSNELDITAIDYSEDMLEQAKKKFPNSSIRFIQMDAQNLQFEEQSFNYVVASLLLSVVPDSDRAFQEMARVTKEEGKIIVFDKFLSPGERLSLSKTIIRPIIGVLGTDIGISFERLLRNCAYKLHKVEDQPVLFNGMYRKIVLKK